MPGNQQEVWSRNRSPMCQSPLKELAELFRPDGAAERFLADLLAFQCRLAKADAGVVFRPGDENRLEILAVYPALNLKGDCTDWIVRAEMSCRGVISSGEVAIEPEDPVEKPGEQPRRHVIVIPVQQAERVRAVAAFLVQAMSPRELALCRERLEITPFLLDYYEMRWTLKERHAALDRLRLVLEVLSVVNSSERFLSAAMALCNEISTRFQCSRVSLGFLNGRYVRVQAMSHTDKFSREMTLVQDIEAAMEECLDQDVEVIHPAAETAQYVSRAAAQLSTEHGPAALLSLPIRQNEDVPAVVTLERPAAHPFTSLGEIEALRLACDLCAPRLAEMHEHDRWFGARVASSTRKRLGLLLGPKHTWIKVWAFFIFILAVFLTFAKGDYRIQASFIFEAPVQQVVVAPFDTFIKSILAVTGDEVEAGKTILAVLERSELRLKLAALKAEQLGYQKQMAASMRDQKTAEAQIAQAQSDKLDAEIRLLEQNIGQATLVAPITGRVVSEDLKRQIGAPVETGKVLFEIARIESLRAELYVPEDLIVDVKAGQEGELASVSHPGQRIRFIVERINPIADVVDHQNVFKVRVRLLEQREWMRPGMEGIAKISVAKRRYAWIWSHRLVNWLRIKLWL